jgi:hypothetical protein
MSVQINKQKAENPIKSYLLSDKHINESCLFELLEQTNIFKKYKVESGVWIKYTIPIDVWVKESGLTKVQTNILCRSIESAHLTLSCGKIVIMFLFFR